MRSATAYNSRYTDAFNDRKIYNSTDQNYEPVMLSWSDFYAFGMQMPGRNGGADYRYLFNGMEHDGEVSGNGNSYTTEFRQYDPRLGRWKSLDPLMAKFPHSSPYVAFANNPVYFTDPYGLEPVNEGEPPTRPGDEIGETETGTDGNVYIWSEKYDEQTKEINGNGWVLVGKETIVVSEESNKKLDKNIFPREVPSDNLSRDRFKYNFPNNTLPRSKGLLERIAEWEKSRGTESEGGSHGDFTETPDNDMGKLGDYNPFEGWFAGGDGDRDSHMRQEIGVGVDTVDLGEGILRKDTLYKHPKTGAIRVVKVEYIVIDVDGDTIIVRPEGSGPHSVNME